MAHISALRDAREHAATLATEAAATLAAVKAGCARADP